LRGVKRRRIALHKVFPMMVPDGKVQRFDGRMVMVGFGCIGQGVLPLLLRHIQMSGRQLTIVSADDEGASVALAHGVELLCRPLTPQNLPQVLGPLLGPGDFLLNLSVDVSSAALIACCGERGALYLDTCIEPWAGGYLDPAATPAERSNYALREAALALRRPRGSGPTAVLTHGANPGLVSHFVKQALLDLAQASGAAAGPPVTQEGWARLSRDLGVRVIHIAERDTQVAQRRHAHGSRAAIYLLRPGSGTRVRSWTPLGGPQHGWLITHGESISIADHLTLGSPARPEYRPTVHYAYRPCDDAVLSLNELAERNWRPQPRQRLLKDDITGGVDELGVLLMGHAHGAYWYGSQLSIERARELAPHNSATSLQVTAAVMAGVAWAMQNPTRGVVEPDDMPYDQILAWCRPYLGDVVGVFSDWTPLDGRSRLFDEDVDAGDPWQFRNFRVA